MHRVLDPPVVGGQELTQGGLLPSHPEDRAPSRKPASLGPGGAGCTLADPPIRNGNASSVRTKLGMFLILQQSDKIGIYLCLSNVWLGHGVPHCGSGCAPSEILVTIVTVPFY